MALTQAFRVSVNLLPLADPRDQIINTWHFATRDATDRNAAFDSATAALNAFYQSVDAQLSTALNGAIPLMQGWDYSDPKPRQPFDEFVATALAPAANRTARELCAVLSYRAEYVSGVSPKRRRGRIYLGPLGSGAIDTTTGLVAAATLTAIDGAAETLLAASEASAQWAWIVYSPTTDFVGTGQIGMNEVIGGWVDNSPGVQRRRGAVATVRSLVT